ncbi:uncharacterized protein LOC144703725 [Wolffia australiana]
MPGSILVSVLGVEDLPSLASEPSVGGHGQFSLKLVMGKAEFQTDGKGDFSFPVLSVRENLRLILYDAAGIEISRSDVKTMEVVEKRNWDSFFPLEGGGRVHLKLQFTLNADELKRVNEMRKAALQRRRVEALNSERIADYMARDKMVVASPSQETQQYLEYHPEKNARQSERHPIDPQKPDDIMTPEMQKYGHDMEINPQKTEKQLKVDPHIAEQFSNLNVQEDEKPNMQEEMRFSIENKEVSLFSGDQIELKDGPSSEETTIPGLKARESIASEEDVAASISLKITEEVAKSSAFQGGDHQIGVQEVPHSEEANIPQPKYGESIFSEDDISVPISSEITNEIRTSSPFREGDCLIEVKEFPRPEDVTQPKAWETILSEEDIAASISLKITEEVTNYRSLEGGNHQIGVKKLNRLEETVILPPKSWESIASDEDSAASTHPKITSEKRKFSSLRYEDHQTGVNEVHDTEEAMIPLPKALESIVSEEDVAASISPEISQEIKKTRSLQGGHHQLGVKEVPRAEEATAQSEALESVGSEEDMAASISPEVTREMTKSNSFQREDYQIAAKKVPQPEEEIIPRPQAWESIVSEDDISASVFPQVNQNITTLSPIQGGDRQIGVKEDPRSKEAITPLRKSWKTIVSEEDVAASMSSGITQGITKSRSLLVEDHQIGSKEVASSEDAITQSKAWVSIVSDEDISASVTPKSTQETSKSSSFQDGNQGKSSARSVKKMISAFETIKSQEPKLPVTSSRKTWMRRVEGVDSLKIRTELANVSAVLAKSFSTGSLSGMKTPALDLTYTRPQEEEKYCTVATEKNTKPNVFEPGSYQNPEKQAAGKYKYIKTSYASTLPYCEEKDVPLDTVQTKEVVTFCSNFNTAETVQNSSARVDKGGPLEGGISYPESGMKKLDSKGTLDFIEKMIDKVTESEYLRKFDCEEVARSSPADKLEEDLFVDQRLSGQSVIDPDYEEKTCSSYLHSTLGNFTLGLFKDDSSDSKIDILAYFDAGQCLIGSHGNHIPRHVCITSGSKQLKDLLGYPQIHL